MKMSWEIQRNKRCSRSKALVAAWTILSNADVLYHFAKKLTQSRAQKTKALDHPSLFNPATL
jgi:hypothetical protein